MSARLGPDRHGGRCRHLKLDRAGDFSTYCLCLLDPQEGPAYAAVQLSYSLDTVGTEAYLATARRTISVRRHSRLVDYRMHEGCNSRAWMVIESDTDRTFDITDLAFAVPPDDAVMQARGIVD